MKNFAKLFCTAAVIIIPAVSFWLAGCSSEQTSLYSHIKTDIIAIKANSRGSSGYQPIPDSLRLRFDKTLRMLRVIVQTTGCGPEPAAKVEESSGRLLIQFDMKNTCVHSIAEFFDVDILVSPVHEDVIRLIVEQRHFDSEEPGIVLLDQLVDVRKLPALK